MDLKLTPLAAEHKKLGAQMGPFGGWLMPIQYTGIIAEHTWTRQSASLFDICHMGEFFVYGDPEKTNLNRIVTINLDKIQAGSCRYGSMLNDKGGVIDDLIVYRTKPDKWMLVVNAARIDTDEANLKRNLSPGTKLENVSAKLGKLDLQGPLSLEIMRQFIGPKISGLKYYTFGSFMMLGEENIISRTGYTGELGYELYLSSDKIADLWNLLLKDKRLKPAGLGARDTLRLEMGYSLYGQDVTEDTTPLEAGLEKFVDFNKDFIGRSALLEKKNNALGKKLIYFITDSRRNPRHNYKIFSEGREVGFVTSGSFSPSLSFGIGIGYVENGCGKIGSKIMIRQQDIEINATVTGKPFYKKGTVKNIGGK
ncbi:MAG: glycine cleavage system aminomethyltransferase GcvT [Candidatus Omnitrophica bacterium]|nr:glycine cleavage system aminomethyltransferase GcvT [Candidatus Omnitrophota bacterium]